MEIFLQIGLVLLLVLLNAFFVASEFALVAVRKTRIQVLVKKGNTTAKLVEKAINNLDTFISATQLGITLSSLALGWIGEPAIAYFLQGFFDEFLGANTSLITSHALSFIIAFSVITFLHIVLGELAPKSIALQRAEKVSLLIITPLSIFNTIFKPFIFLLNGAGSLILRVIGFSAPSGHQLVHSEEEIKIILQQSAAEGEIEKEEAEMVYRVLKLADLPVKEIMVPRSKIIAFNIDASVKSVIKKTEENLHSRFPVYKDNIDNVVGFIHIKEIYRYALSSTKQKIFEIFYKTFLRREGEIGISKTKLIRKILVVSQLQEIDEVLLEMRKKQVHIAVVHNNIGKTVGIITLEDILETLVGEIHDEFEKPDIITKS